MGRYPLTMTRTRFAHDDIAQSDIIFGFLARWAWCATSDSDHQADLNVGKAPEHILGDCCCRALSHAAQRQTADDDVMLANATKCVRVCVSGILVY